MTGEYRLDGLGISMSVPTGWDAAIFQREPDEGEATFPVVHATTATLVPERGDFGSSVVEQLSEDGAFIALVEFEFDPDSFMTRANQRMPQSLSSKDFSGSVHPRVIDGQGGCQLFLTTAGRCFCLYVAIGSLEKLSLVIDEVNQVLGSVSISPVAVSDPVAPS